MACHLQYFNVAGYFNSLGYINNMGIDLQSGSMFGAALNEADRKALEEAIQKSDTDSKDGKLTGIVGLIQLVESLQDKFGVAHQHKHPTPDIVGAMCSNHVLVQRYGLESLAKKLAPDHQLGHGHHHHASTHINTSRK